MDADAFWRNRRDNPSQGLERAGHGAVGAPPSAWPLTSIFLNMKFRTHIIVALSATAFVPFVAWSVLHLGDMERRIAEADLEQHSATVDAAALVACSYGDGC